MFLFPVHLITQCSIHRPLKRYTLRSNWFAGLSVDVTAQVIHLGQLHLTTWVLPAFNQPIQLNIDRKLTGMMIYSGVSYFFRECSCRFYISCQDEFQQSWIWEWIHQCQVSSRTACSNNQNIEEDNMGIHYLWWATLASMHSQKQSAHWAVDITAKVVLYWL